MHATEGKFKMFRITTRTNQKPGDGKPDNKTKKTRTSILN